MTIREENKMNYDMLCRFKRLAEMLGMEADKLDDLIRLEKLDEHLGCQVYLKAECMQITGAFKLR